MVLLGDCLISVVFCLLLACAFFVSLFVCLLLYKIP